VEVPAVMADIRKFQARTGWAPAIPFEQSMADVLEYWREQVRTGATDPTPLEMRIVARRA
jgi:hypothetical protein